jgi:hypothetical protein
MDSSTEKVTLYAAFVNDVLNVYKDKPDFYGPLSRMAEGEDLSDPFNKVPMHTYNEMCNWIEKNIGKVNTKKVGREIGKTAFEAMRQHKLITDKPSPKQLMEALVKVASQMIQDPKKRGWEIMSSTANSIVMRRTQTFNSSLQFGLLETLISKSTVLFPSVDLQKSVEKGDEYDEYLITWKGTLS